jgi:hypothetical protein
VRTRVFAVQFYGYLSQQQNMMQDYIRTSTYQRAILDNSVDFAGKVRSDECGSQSRLASRRLYSMLELDQESCRSLLLKLEQGKSMLLKRVPWLNMPK